MTLERVVLAVAARKLKTEGKEENREQRLQLENNERNRRKKSIENGDPSRKAEKIEVKET